MWLRLFPPLQPLPFAICQFVCVFVLCPAARDYGREYCVCHCFRLSDLPYHLVSTYTTHEVGERGRFGREMGS